MLAPGDDDVSHTRGLGLGFDPFFRKFLDGFVPSKYAFELFRQQFRSAWGDCEELKLLRSGRASLLRRHDVGDVSAVVDGMRRGGDRRELGWVQVLSILGR